MRSPCSPCGATPPAEVDPRRWTFHGPALRVVRVGPDGTWLAAESVVAVAGAFRAAERRGRSRSVDCRTAASSWARPTAIELDAGWAGDTSRDLSVLEHDGWSPVAPLDRPGVVDAATVGRLQARTGHRFLWLLLGDR